MNSSAFETTPPTKLFFRCAIPSMISMAIGSLYSVADGVFVGRFIGSDSLAAVNLVMPLLMISFAFSNMIATGASVQIAMQLGQKNREAACRTFSFSILVILLMSVVLGGVGFVFARPIVNLLGKGATEGAIKAGIEYLKVYSAFMPLLPLFFATDNFLRVCGREKTSMMLNITTQILNIVLDFFLIAVLHQGIWAAAFTSCISIALGTVISLWMFRGKKQDLFFLKGSIPIRQFAKLMANGASEFFSNIASSVMAIVLNVFLLHYGGTTAVAAMSVLMYIDSVVGMLVLGMCESLQPAISYCHGAGNKKKVIALERRVLASSAVLSMSALVFMRYGGKFVVPFFIKDGDATLLDMSLTAMNLFSFSYLFGWVDMSVSSLFTAVDRPKQSFVLSILGTLLFPAVCLIVLSVTMGLNGVYLMPTVSGALAALVAVCMVMSL